MENIIISIQCEYNNCLRKASYGENHNTPIRCFKHKENMRLVSKICICGKASPSFNNECETKALYCSQCKTNTMFDVKHDKYKCFCGKSRPSYNNPGEKKALYCYECKTDSMINVITPKCFCGKSIPNYNNEGEQKALYCFECKTDSMINVRSKKCFCGKSQPSFNNEGKQKALYCFECKTDTMINVKIKKCFCGKSEPYFNNKGEQKALYCFKCKTDTMINVKSKKCFCGKSEPCFNNKWEQKALYCFECKTTTMVDVKHKKCLGFINNGITEDCPYNATGNTKYKNYCTECFKRNFPLDPLTFQIRSKTKEIAVRDYINQHFDGFQHNKKLQTGHCDCTMRRSIDHRKLIGNTLLAIETDENQHKSYDKMDEEIRYDDLYMAHSGKWVYIRFNPDKYIDKKGVRKNPMLNARLEKLKNEIEKQIKRIENEENKQLVERVYMYYDNYD
jgi:hypothetical protein